MAEEERERIHAFRDSNKSEGTIPTMKRKLEFIDPAPSDSDAKTPAF
jgi:hypothetical protein